MPDFGQYDGRPIRKSSVTIRGTGDGLSDALAIEPRTFSPMDRAFIVLEVEMSDVDHRYIEKSDCWNRVQVCKAVRGAFIDDAIAKPVLDGIAVAISELQDKEAGQDPLALEGERAQGRVEEHEKGLHKRKRKDCPLCAQMQVPDEVGAKRAEHDWDDARNIAKRVTGTKPPRVSKRPRKAVAKKAGGRGRS